jgi:Lon protease-like protein
MSVEIPLFPLGVVLFPHMPLPLRIFEERYREMMRDCEEQGTTFGIVAIREGVEAFGGAIPHEVGTLAQLRKVERLDDGGYNLLVVGASRFRVMETSLHRPYLTGTVEYLEDRAGDGAATTRLAQAVATAFSAYANRLRELADQPAAELELPEDPELLSYLVAATLQVETPYKQRLLETDSAQERLAICLRLLGREALLLDRSLARREMPIAPVSAN